MASYLATFARKTKITFGLSFFKVPTSVLSLTAWMSWLCWKTFVMKVYESEEEQRLVEEEEIAKEKEKTAKEAGRRKRGHRKKRPTKKRVDE